MGSGRNEGGRDVNRKDGDEGGQRYEGGGLRQTCGMCLRGNRHRGHA